MSEHIDPSRHIYNAPNTFSSRTQRKRIKKSPQGTFGKALEGSRASGATDDAKPINQLDALHPNAESYLSALFDEVFAQGRELIESPTYSAALVYRKRVRAFMARALGEAYQVVSVESPHNILRRKRYILVQEINAEVAKMIEGLRLAQQKELQIIESIGLIHGMLINLVG